MFFFKCGPIHYIYSMYIILCMYVCVCMCVCMCVRACVHGVCVPGDITLSTAEMGFLESVFEVHYVSRPVSSNNITLLQLSLMSAPDRPVVNLLPFCRQGQAVSYLLINGQVQAVSVNITSQSTLL